MRQFHCTLRLGAAPAREMYLDAIDASAAADAAFEKWRHDPTIDRPSVAAVIHVKSTTDPREIFGGHFAAERWDRSEGPTVKDNE
jgi:hypothetical protein